MSLLLDIGNSRIKPAILHAGTLQPLPASDYDPQRLTAWCAATLSNLPAPSAIRVANVAGERVAAELISWCRQQWQLQPRFVATERSAAGIRNGYDNAQDLGIDRWLAMIAARQKIAGPFCVVGAGTALTVDAVNAAGEHLGGLILPGVQLMQQALRQGTHAIGIEHPLPEQLMPGRTTASGVAAGSGYAITGLIERFLAELSANHGPGWRVLITGGDADAIAPLCRFELQHEPRLVLEGLAWYAQHRDAGCVT